MNAMCWMQSVECNVMNAMWRMQCDVMWWIDEYNLLMQCKYYNVMNAMWWMYCGGCIMMNAMLQMQFDECNGMNSM